MKILILSTLKRRVGKDVFASRSRIIYELASGLAKKGHEVSLLGTADSQIQGVKVLPIIESSWVDLPKVENEFVRDVGTLVRMSKKLLEIQNQFDIIHSHTYPDIFSSVIENELKVPLVTTLHAVWDQDLDQTLQTLQKSHFVCLSNAYRKECSDSSKYDVVYNGVDTALYTFSEKKNDYLFWLGRLPKSKNADGSFIDPKGVKEAIKLVQSSGSKLILAGTVEDKEFFDKEVRPHLNDRIIWEGEVASEQSISVERIIELMQGAKAFLFTANQVEPFGLVMAEALSCGTPVIAFNTGAVSEILVDGLTGFVIDKSDGVEGLEKSLKQLNNLSEDKYREMIGNCRKRVEEMFTVEKMVENYENLYTKLING